MITLGSAVVRIRTVDDRVVGAGFLVGERQVLTCAHVIAQALDVLDNTLEIPQDDVLLDFPLVAPEQRLTARIVCWKPIQPDERGDIAGLELIDTPPVGASPVCLQYSEPLEGMMEEDLWGHSFRTFGFPAGHDSGVWASGRLLGQEATGWIQIEDVKQTGYFVVPGFSGAPLWDEELRSVVGMCVTAEGVSEIRAAFIIPADALMKAWPELTQLIQPFEESETISVYVSSTYSDLVEYRHQVHEQLRKKQYMVLPTEEYGDMDKRPLERCSGEVASCQLYIGIFAWCYGDIPPGQERSITELEYRQASELGIEQLIFLLDEDAPWPRSKMEKGIGGEKIEILRQKLMEAHPVKFFKNTDELTKKVIASVNTWAQTRLEANMSRLRDRRDQADRKRHALCERQRVVNLRPLDMTHTFKNRVRERRVLCEHLSEAYVRLVSVVGRGGIGKTALVSHVLADLERGKLPIPGEERGFAVDGILYLSARSTGLSLERIYTDIGRMLGEPTSNKLATYWANKDASLAAKVEFLLENMQDGLYLILLDNLEDLLTEDGEITEEGLRLFVEHCLIQPSGARLIITTREQAKLPVAVLHGARSIPLREGLPEEEAVELLRELDPQGMFGLHDAPEDELRRAARMTKGIPRALEILTGILRRDPATSLSSLLADECLFGKQVVEQLVAEGYHKLGENERRIIEALAVFNLPVKETAVAFLLNPWFPGIDIRYCLRRLVNSYFVMANRITSEYSLHSLDQDYAYGQLPQSSSEAEESDVYNQRSLEKRAADFYASIRKPQNEWKVINDLFPQLSEFEHLVKAEYYEDACRLLNSIDLDYLFLWGHYNRLAEFREKLVGHLTDPHLIIANVSSLGRACQALGQVRQSIEFYEKALTITRKIGDRSEESSQLGLLANAYHDLGQFEKALNFHEQSLMIVRELGNRRAEGSELGGIGLAYYALRKFDQAIEFFESALTIFHELEDRRNEGFWIGNLGRIYRNLWLIEQAVNCSQEALSIAREIGDRRGEGFWCDRLGLAYRTLGQIESAIEFHNQGLDIAREINDRRGEGAALSNLGVAYHAQGQFVQAIEYYEQALTIAQEIGDRRGETIRIGRMGDVYSALKQIDRAIELYQQALSIAQEIGDLREKSFHLLRLGRMFLVKGSLQEASRCNEEVLSLNMPQSAYQVIAGIVLLYQRDPAAKETFNEIIARCQALLEKTARLYEVRYALAVALVGGAVCDPQWAEDNERVKLLAPALEEYRQALDICSAPGVINEALRDVEMIRAAGIEGLEPVFKLLETVS